VGPYERPGPPQGAGGRRSAFRRLSGASRRRAASEEARRAVDVARIAVEWVSEAESGSQTDI
jgi:hypothetical protein